MRPMVGVADAIRSAVVLQASPTTETAILSLLGLPVDHEPSGSDEPAERVPSIPVHEPDPPLRSPGPANGPTPPAQPAPAPVAERPTSTAAVPSAIEQVLVGNRTSGWETTADPLPPPRAGEEAYRPEPEPLLPRARSFDLLTAMAGVDEYTGSFDLARMTDRVARGEPFVEIRARRTSRRHGIQLLIDVSASMAPFAGDCAAVREQVGSMFGSGAVVGRFVGSPLRGAGPGSRPWQAYRPPRPPTPVLLVTDLGIGPTDDAGERADVEEWLRFAQIVGRAGCRVAALVPQPRIRVPISLLRAIDVVEWEDTTTTATARNIIDR